MLLTTVDYSKLYNAQWKEILEFYGQKYIVTAKVIEGNAYFVLQLLNGTSTRYRVIGFDCPEHINPKQVTGSVILDGSASSIHEALAVIAKIIEIDNQR